MAKKEVNITSSTIESISEDIGFSNPTRLRNLEDMDNFRKLQKNIVEAGRIRNCPGYEVLTKMKARGK